MHNRPEPHHRRSIRLQEYDYSAAGAYFVTICTWNRECLFGEIGVGTMRFTESGKIADNCWRAIPDHFSKADLDEFAIMPNHVHGIIVFNDWAAASQSAFTNRPGPPPRSLGAVVAAFKSAVSRRINVFRPNPGGPVWQRNYYEHIIRNDRDLANIRRYIIDNPAKWDQDEHNPRNPSPVLRA